MAFPARVFRILIASPSDVTDEREIAVRTIQEWNDLNSAERHIVLLPLRWETHSAPEYGKRPQEVINRQVVDHSDLLVGIFWTRVGSPTEVSESGTIEEIERVALRGKPVMLYFSKVKQEPDIIDISQLQKLREFKAKTFPKALVESYASQIEFRDKLAKQLEIQLRTLLAAESENESGTHDSRPITDVLFEFAEPRRGDRLGNQIKLTTTLLRVEGAAMLPDYEDPREPKAKEGTDASYVLISRVTMNRFNKNYYREQAEFLARSSFFRPIRFWLKNVGAVGARDVYVDLKVDAPEEAGLALTALSRDILTPPRRQLGFGAVNFSLFDTDDSDEDSEALTTAPNVSLTALDIGALQPQREIAPPAQFALGVEKSCTVTITATIYADTLSAPVARALAIDWTVDRETMSAEDLLRRLRQSTDRAGSP